MSFLNTKVFSFSSHWVTSDAFVLQSQLSLEVFFVFVFLFYWLRCSQLLFQWVWFSRFRCVVLCLFIRHQWIYSPKTPYSQHNDPKVFGVRFVVLIVLFLIHLIFRLIHSNYFEVLALFQLNLGSFHLKFAHSHWYLRYLEQVLTRANWTCPQLVNW